MGIRFNADEALEMAERIEEQGARFYRRAAELHARPRGEDWVAFLLRLAEVEDGHRETFAAMRRDLAREEWKSTAFDPYAEAALYLQAMADSHGGEGAPAATAALTGKETPEQILRAAIGLEQKSILYYLGLKEMVPAHLGRDQVEVIIAEEKTHLANLTRELRRATGA